MLHQEIQNAGEEARLCGRSADLLRIEAGDGKEAFKQVRLSGNEGDGIDSDHFRFRLGDRITIWHIVCNSLSVPGKLRVR